MGKTCSGEVNMADFFRNRGNSQYQGPEGIWIGKERDRHWLYVKLCLVTQLKRTPGLPSHSVQRLA